LARIFGSSNDNRVGTGYTLFVTERLSSSVREHVSAGTFAAVLRQGLFYYTKDHIARAIASPVSVKVGRIRSAAIHRRSRTLSLSGRKRKERKGGVETPPSSAPAQSGELASRRRGATIGSHPAIIGGHGLSF
jgi:hypothetical protein